MKKKLILITLILGFLFTKAQTYVPFPDSNVYWNEIELYQGYCDPPEYCRHSYFIDGDTIINSEPYHKIYDNDSTNISYVGALREFEKKIYYIDKYCDHSIKLYDFNLQVGDTMQIPTELCDYTYGYTAVVSSIDSVLIEDMTYRKRINTSYGWSWIEGIGSSDGLLYPSFVGIACICNLYAVCVKQNNQVIYLDETYVPCFDFIASNQELNITETKLKVYPNPTINKSSVNVSSTSEIIKRIDIYNSQGCIIKTISKIETKKTTLQTQSLNSGLYFLKVYFKNKILFERLIIQ